MTNVPTEVATVVKYHLAEIAASISPTPRLTLIVRSPGGAGFAVTTEDRLDDAWSTFEEALREGAK